jgi:putative hemolysin
MLTKRVIQQTPDFLAQAIFRREGRYVLRLADTEADLDAVQKLRYDVFNVELGEGLPSSAITRRDQDEFDSVCHHLMIIDDEKNEVVGTYRIQTGEMATAGNGFYSAGEFDLSLLPDEIPHNSVELGRACIAAEHRHTQALLLLWKGIAAYLKATGKRYLFGCSSLSSQSMTEARAVMKLLEAGAHIHPFLYVRPRPGFACDLSDEKEMSGEIAIPKLFKTYLRVGAKVCGAPAIDRQFGTIDFFVLMDIRNLDAFSQRLLLGHNRK